MTTRFTARPVNAFGVHPLPTGYDNVASPSNLTLPAVGIEDVDKALFDLFNVEMNLTVADKEGSKRVPIVFASGEKWAMLKKGRALRDRSGSLLLPLITIGRANIQQLPSEDIAGRGINQQTGDLVIKRRLAPDDRTYQSLVNRMLLKNQDNLALSPLDALVPNQVTTEREIGDLSDNPTYSDGGLLASNKLNNVWEFIIVPAPQFFTAIYEVTIWTQYTTHMNQVLETLISSFLPQGNAWRLETAKGYWFVATVDGNLYSAENNFDDMSAEERIIKYKFTVKVPGYILASAAPGTPVPIRRFVSSPQVSFNIIDSGTPGGTEDPFLGSDDPTLPDAERSTTLDQRRDGKTRLYPSRRTVSPHDPALLSYPRGTAPGKYRKIVGIDRTGKRVVRYVKIRSVNAFTGETTFSATDLSDLSVIVSDD